MTWSQILRVANVGQTWLRPNNLKNHEQNRHLDVNHLHKISELLSEDTTRRHTNPISVLVRGNRSLGNLPLLWDPPEELELVVIGGWHRVCALQKWLESNSIQDEGYLGRWYATVYTDGQPFRSVYISDLIAY